MARKGKRKADLTNPVTLARLETYGKALALRQQGKTFLAIAQQLGLSSAHVAAQQVRQALDVTLVRPSEELRELELSRLDALLAVWWPRAVQGVPVRDDETGEVLTRYNPASGEAEPILQPSSEALDSVLKVLDRRYKLLGLDHPPRERGKDDPKEMVMAILRRVVAEDTATLPQTTTLAVASWRPADVTGETVVVDGHPPRLPPPPALDGWDGGPLPQGEEEERNDV